MFKSRILRFILIAALLIGSADGLYAKSSIKVVKLTVTNPQSVARNDIPFVISIEKIRRIAPDFSGQSFIVTTSGEAALKDDAGAMSAWYIWNSIGLFPNAGQPFYYLLSPVYPKTTINLSGGKTFVIEAPQTSDANIYSIGNFERQNFRSRLDQTR